MGLEGLVAVTKTTDGTEHIVLSDHLPSLLGTVTPLRELLPPWLLGGLRSQGPPLQVRGFVHAPTRVS